MEDNNPNKKIRLSLPFDIDLYINNEYQKHKTKWEKMYTNQDLIEELNNLNKKLQNERSIYYKHFDPIILALQNNQDIIEIQDYGSNNQTYLDSLMLHRALENIRYIVTSKGYSYREKINYLSDGSSIKKKLYLNIN